MTIKPTPAQVRAIKKKLAASEQKRQALKQAKAEIAAEKKALGKKRMQDLMDKATRKGAKGVPSIDLAKSPKARRKVDKLSQRLTKHTGKPVKVRKVSGGGEHKPLRDIRRSGKE